MRGGGHHDSQSREVEEEETRPLPGDFRVSVWIDSRVV